MTSLLRGKFACLVLSCCFLSSVQAAWINEIHYDNTGTDVGEFVEIVLEPGEVIGDFSLAYYNGSGGATYSGPTNLNMGAVVNGYSIFWFDGTSIQNGPDGIALLQSGSLVPGQFLSYEGSFTAVGGAADGLTSTDLGLAESSSTPVGQSLQATGTGTIFSDFLPFTGPIDDTPGEINIGQTLVPEPSALVTCLVALLTLTILRRRRRI